MRRAVVGRLVMRGPVVRRAVVLALVMMTGVAHIRRNLNFSTFLDIKAVMRWPKTLRWAVMRRSESLGWAVVWRPKSLRGAVVFPLMEVGLSVGHSGILNLFPFLNGVKAMVWRAVVWRAVVRKAMMRGHM